MTAWITIDELMSYLDEHGMNSYGHIAYQVLDNFGCLDYVDITPDSNSIFDSITNGENIGLVTIIFDPEEV